MAGGNHCIAITTDGTAFGWGSNSALQLSHENEFSAADQPLIAVYSPIKLEKNLGAGFVTDVAAGNETSVFITRNKYNGETEVFGCGRNLCGELGNGNLSHINDVKKVESLSNYKITTSEGEKEVTIKQIECGDNHCIALLSVGAVLEWGANEFGQLGNKRRVFTEHPIIVSDFVKENVLHVSARTNNTAVISEYNEKEEKKEKEKKKQLQKKSTKR